MGERFLDLSKELKNVRTIELVCKNSFFLERLFWAILGVLGIAWAFYFVPHNFQVWNNNPSIKMQGDLDLSQIRYPSISITPSGTTKYAIAERVGNFLNPKELSLNLRKVRNLFYKCAMLYKNGYATQFDISGTAIADSYYFDDYYQLCLKTASKESGANVQACKVVNQYYIRSI